MNTQKKPTLSLQKLVAIDKELRDFGFKWEQYDQILTQITRETAEVKEVLKNKESQTRLQEELGDLLHATISLMLFTNSNVDEVITSIEEKLSARFAHMKQNAKDQGYITLKDKPTELLLKFWSEAKKDIL